MVERLNGGGGRGAEIAGPRRVRRRIAVRPVEIDPAADIPTRQNARPLPALDYDEPTVKVIVVAGAAAASAALEETRPGRAQRAHGLRLFAVGVALGAIAVSFVGSGEASHSLRAWSASAIRSIEHRPTPPADLPVTAAVARLPKPCSLTDEDCAALMAPYLAVDPPTTAPPPTVDVPVIDVNALPMVQEPPKPPVIRVARAAAPHKPKGPDAAPPVSDDDALMDVAPPALPHPEDALDPPAPPAKASPSKPPPLFDSPSGADTAGPVAAASPIKT